MASFLTGDAAKVYEEAQKLSGAYKALQSEVAQLRFRVNFGTPICQNCDGLHAGPNVVATCYQAKECHYTNIRTTKGHSLRVLEHLLDNE